MIVPITITPSSAFSAKLPPSIASLGHDGLFLIELQGTLDVECPASSGRDGELAGMLDTADMTKPTLVIGHHLLEGKVVGLPRPVGVLHKQVQGAGCRDGLPGWDMVGVVRKKMVFSKRPMPIASARRP